MRAEPRLLLYRNPNNPKTTDNTQTSFHSCYVVDAKVAEISVVLNPEITLVCQVQNADEAERDGNVFEFSIRIERTHGIDSGGECGLLCEEKNR